MRHVLAQSVDGAVSWWLSLPVWIWVAFIFGFSVLVGFFVERIIIAVLRRSARRTQMKVDDVIVQSLHPSLSIFIIVGLVWLLVQFLPVRFLPETMAVIDNAGLTLMVFAAAWGAVRLVRGLLNLRAQVDDRWQPLSVTGGRLSAIVIYLMAFLIIIRQYGIEITPILTTLGIAGLAVALALQDTLANFFSGLWIQAQRSLQPGHYVRIEDNKLEGFVVEVGWRTTKIRTLPGNLIDVPNQKMAQSTIQDFWLPEPKMGTSITVVTGFEADPERVVPILLEECMAAADEVSFILKEPAPAARLNKAVDQGWEYWMSMWVPYYYNQWNAQGYVLNRIRKRFLKEGIRMPYPIRENHVVPADRADVTVAITAPRSPEADVSSYPSTLPVAAVAEGVRPPDGKSIIRPTK